MGGSGMFGGMGDNGRGSFVLPRAAGVGLADGRAWLVLSRCRGGGRCAGWNELRRADGDRAGGWLLDFRRLVGGVESVLDDASGRTAVRAPDSVAPADSGWSLGERSGIAARGREPVSSCILLADSRRTPSA